jgi:hypothetical protein
MTPVTKMNVTGVISICYPGDYNIKRFFSILRPITQKERRKESMKMRILLITVISLIAGFAIGISLSEIIGIVGVLGFGRVMGIKYLPIYLAIASAIVVNLIAASARRKSKRLINKRERRIE